MLRWQKSALYGESLLRQQDREKMYILHSTLVLKGCFLKHRQIFEITSVNFTPVPEKHCLAGHGVFSIP